MAYTKQTWTTGDTITAEKLNHMEGGIESSNSNFIKVSGTLDSNQIEFPITYNQAVAAFDAGKQVLFVANSQDEVHTRMMVGHKTVYDNDGVTPYQYVLEIYYSQSEIDAADADNNLILYW